MGNRMEELCINMSETKEYKVAARCLTYCEIDAFHWVLEQAEVAGSQMSFGEPWEIEVEVTAGDVWNMFDVVRPSGFRVEVIVFGSKQDHELYLKTKER